MIPVDEQGARDWVASLPEADAAAMARLDRLAVLLREENARQNLVSVASLDAVWNRHIADSAQLLTFLAGDLRADGVWLDLGTGAGFPGLAIAAICPDREVIMVESRARRVEWLRAAAADLGLDKATVIASRLEQVEDFDARVISARAFAPLDRLLNISARFSTSDTQWLLPKGRSARDEVNQLTGWSHMFHVEQSLTDPEAGIVVGTVSGRQSGKKARKR